MLWVGDVSSTIPANTKLAFVRLTNAPGPQKVVGLLAEDLDPADDSVDAPATATVTLILGSPAALSSRTIDGVNRSIDASAESLTFVELGYDAHLREWSFDWIDCGPQEASASSGGGGGTTPPSFFGTFGGLFGSGFGT